MLTLSAHMDRRSADIKREALGRISISLAGAKPNCFYQLLKEQFGYLERPASEPKTVTEEEADLPSRAPPKQKSQSKGSDSEGNYPAPKLSNAVGFKPGKNASEYYPTREEGDDDYGCPFKKCDFLPKQKLDLVCTHIRRHLNICINCHYCTKSFWSIEGWKKHTTHVHPNLPKVPDDTEEPPTFTPLGDVPEIVNVKDKEEEALNKALQLPTPDLNVEKQFMLVDADDENATKTGSGTKGSTPAPMDL